MIIIDDGKTFYIECENISYIMDVHNGYLRHVYFGKRICRDNVSSLIFDHLAGYVTSINGGTCGRESLETLPQEMSFFGLGDYRDFAFYAQDECGNRAFNLKFDSYELLESKPQDIQPRIKSAQTLVITLIDELKKFKINLLYTAYEQENAITRSAQIINLSDTLIINRAYSFSIDFCRSDFDIISLHGKHSAEAQIERISSFNGKYEIDSARGISSHQHNPFVALVSKNCNETCGEAYGFNLVYSGSFNFTVEKSQFSATRILGGINSSDFSWELKPGETFYTPEVVMVFSDCGLNKMSQSFHNLYRGKLINGFSYKPRPIVINSWETTYFNFDTAKLKKIVDSCDNLNIDTFVLDDGWFGERNDDKTGLGDWNVNLTKLSGGLCEIADYCAAKNLNFGLWIEPEMISKNSKLYEAHPDWAIGTMQRERVESRNQYVLDLTNKDVLEYIKYKMYDIISSAKISYIKWDMNRPLTEFYSMTQNAKNQKEFAHRYVLALYELAEFLTQSFPNVLFEGCAGGGGRFDPAMLKYFPQIWASDSTDANERVKIQYGLSLCYPLSCISCHVASSPAHQTARIIPLETRVNVASFGTFGYELCLEDVSSIDKTRIKESNERYRERQDLVLFGDLYRAISPFDGNESLQIIMSKDKMRGMGLFYRRLTSYSDGIIMVRLVGLMENKKYYIPQYNIKAAGSTLMNLGFQFKPSYSDYQSLLFDIIAEE